MINGKEYLKSENPHPEVIEQEEIRKRNGLTLEKQEETILKLVKTYDEWKDDESITIVKWFNTYIPKVMCVKLQGMDDSKLKKYTEFMRYQLIISGRLQMLNLYGTTNPTFEQVDDYYDVERFTQSLFAIFHDMNDFNAKENGVPNTLTFKQFKKRVMKKTTKRYGNAYGMDRGLNNLKDIEVTYINGTKDYWIKRRDINQINKFVPINKITKH